MTTPSAIDQLTVSALARVEIVSALQRRVRDGTINAADYPRHIADFDGLCAGAYRVIEVTDLVITHARTLLEAHPLRAYDALHLASALLANAALLTAGFPALIFLAADVRLLDAARAEGLAVDNPNDHL
jgi:predicted nucleic acid-binding protein